MRARALASVRRSTVQAQESLASAALATASSTVRPAPTPLWTRSTKPLRANRNSDRRALARVLSALCDSGQPSADDARVRAMMIEGGRLFPTTLNTE